MVPKISTGTSTGKIWQKEAHVPVSEQISGTVTPEMEKVIKIAELHFWPKKISTKKWPKNDLK